MYTNLWNSVRAYISAERMQDEIEEYFERSRWSSFDKLLDLAYLIAGKMEAAGMQDVRLIEFPADGVTSFGGWVMPQAYDVQEARLELLGPNGKRELLADYQSNPTSLMLYSMPSMPAAEDAELVVADQLHDMTPESISGRIVLTSGLGVEYSQAAMRAGALGVVSDCSNTHRHFKHGAEVEATNEWHNYTIPPWKSAGKGFGFSISPNAGRRLRSLLAAGEKVTVSAIVKTREYDGILPVVSACLPGELTEEIVLTGHFDEFGADDNCSQIAVALEACRTIKAMVDAGSLPPLKRTIRILLPMEVRGFNALVGDREEIRKIRAGLNIDTVGTDQNRATSTCTLSESLTPSYADEFAAELLARTAQENPLFRWRRTPPEMIDNIFGEPLIGAPVPQIWHFSETHHLATDTPDRISPTMLTSMARLAATYAGFLANAGLDEALWLAELSAQNGVIRLEQAALEYLRADGDDDLISTVGDTIIDLHTTYSLKVAGARVLVPSIGLLPNPMGTTIERSKLTGSLDLLPTEAFDLRVEQLQEELRSEFERVLARVNIVVVETGDLWSIPPRKCVPLKSFRGFLGFEDLTAEALKIVREDLNIPPGWGAPMWLQHALMYANGKRTTDEIAAMIWRRHSTVIEGGRLERVLVFLAQRGHVKLRPFITQAEVRSALETAGIEEGDVVLGHFALSWFGYIDGGAEALVETILSIVGQSGTLVMPAFSFSWLGRRVFDPELTPSRVGAVTEYFRKRDDVVRSAHPTHSFAATGRHAFAITADHDYTKSPLSQDGPLGRIEMLDGKILMFAPRNSNTAMHVGEYRGGMPMLSLVCPVIEFGRRVEAVVPDCPWHVQFGPAYEKLYTRGQISEAQLGENSICVMRCVDAIRAQEEVMRETPVLLLQPGCSCEACTKLKDYCLKRSI